MSVVLFLDNSPLSLILHNIQFSFDSPLCRPPHFGNLSIRRRKKKEKIRHMSISSFLSFFYYYYYFLCPPCPLTFFEMKTKYKIKKFCPYKKKTNSTKTEICESLSFSLIQFLSFLVVTHRMNKARVCIHPSPDENKIIINIYKLIESSRWRRRRLVWLLLIGAEELLVKKGIGTKPWVILLRNITHSYSWNVTPVRITPHSLSTCVCVSRFLFITSKDFLSEGKISF